MELPWTSLQGFAGSAGVGSLAILGIFLFVDSLHEDVLPVVEFYAKTATWAVVAAIPVLAITYVLGLLLIGTGGLLLDAVPSAYASARFEDLVLISRSSLVPVAERYHQLYQESHVLAGSALAFVILSLGGAADARNLPSLRLVVYGGAFLGLVFAFLIFLLAVSKSHAAHTLAQAL